MYCPSCGAESTFGLNYCKHCGGNLSEPSQTAQPPTRNTLAAFILAAATVAIVLGGLAIVFTQTLALVGPQPPGYTQPVSDSMTIGGMMVFFGSSAIVLVSLMLIKLFSRVMGYGFAVEKPSRRVASIPPQQRSPQIQAPPIVVSSVTEHTTRNFDPRVFQRDTSE
jgi:hypothetical protein